MLAWLLIRLLTSCSGLVLSKRQGCSTKDVRKEHVDDEVSCEEKGGGRCAVE